MKHSSGNYHASCTKVKKKSIVGQKSINVTIKLIQSVKMFVQGHSHKTIRSAGLLSITQKYIHYRIDTTAVSLPHTPKSWLSTNVPYLYDIKHQHVLKHQKPSKWMWSKVGSQPSTWVSFWTPM